MLTNNEKPRYLAAVILRKMGVACVVWFEDALREYGVPTMLFDLYLLVPNIDTAARVLESSGWTTIEQNRGKVGNELLSLDHYPQHRLSPPHPPRTTDLGPDSTSPAHMNSSTMLVTDDERTEVVLLAAATWNFLFRDDCLSKPLFPTLEALLDGLIATQLDHVDDEKLQSHLRGQIGYLYGYSPDLQARSFADRLLYEHRQYHFDVCSGMSYETLRFAAHQSAIRDALRTNKIELRECSAPRNNEDLFNQVVQARLLEAMLSSREKTSLGIES